MARQLLSHQLDDLSKTGKSCTETQECVPITRVAAIAADRMGRDPEQGREWANYVGARETVAKMR